MYLLATTTKYQNGIKYYSKNGNTYTLSPPELFQEELFQCLCV